MRGLIVGIGIAIVLWSVAVIALIALGRRALARELVTLIPNLLVLFRGLLRDPRVPRGAKLWLAFAMIPACAVGFTHIALGYPTGSFRPRARWNSPHRARVRRCRRLR